MQYWVARRAPAQTVKRMKERGGLRGCMGQEGHALAEPAPPKMNCERRLSVMAAGNIRVQRWVDLRVGR